MSAFATRIRKVIFMSVWSVLRFDWNDICPVLMTSVEENWWWLMVWSDIIFQCYEKKSYQCHRNISKTSFVIENLDCFHQFNQILKMNGFQIFFVSDWMSHWYISIENATCVPAQWLVHPFSLPIVHDRFYISSANKLNVNLLFKFHWETVTIALNSNESGKKS